MLTRVFVCGTRAVVRAPGGILYRVVCASCGGGGTVAHSTKEAAMHAATRDSNKPCQAGSRYFGTVRVRGCGAC